MHTESSSGIRIKPLKNTAVLPTPVKHSKERVGLKVCNECMLIQYESKYVYIYIYIYIYTYIDTSANE